MDLAKFGYKINVKVKIFKTFIYILGYILEPCIEIWRVLYILVSFWLLKISKNHIISALIGWQACTI